MPLALPRSFDRGKIRHTHIILIYVCLRHILILDEFTYGAEADPAMLSSLQHAWDQQFKTLQMIIVLCGSHVHAMETLQTRQSPLFGRLTGQWHLRPLAFADLREFLPSVSTSAFSPPSTTS